MAAYTPMHHFDGTRESIDFLRYDLRQSRVLPAGIEKSAVIGVGGGRDAGRASVRRQGHHRHRAQRNLHRPAYCDPFYSSFSNLRSGARPETRGRRCAILVCSDRADVRFDPDEPDRHVGGDQRRRLLVVGERALHPEGWRAFTRRAQRSRRVYRQPLGTAGMSTSQAA